MAKRETKPNAKPDVIGKDWLRLALHVPWRALATLFAQGVSLISRRWAMPVGQALAAIDVIRTSPYLLHYPRRMPAKTTAWQRFTE